jgi:hypothetical protein
MSFAPSGRCIRALARRPAAGRHHGGAPARPLVRSAKCIRPLARRPGAGRHHGGAPARPLVRSARCIRPLARWSSAGSHRRSGEALGPLGKMHPSARTTNPVWPALAAHPRSLPLRGGDTRRGARSETPQMFPLRAPCRARRTGTDSFSLSTLSVSPVSMTNPPATLHHAPPRSAMLRHAPALGAPSATRASRSVMGPFISILRKV